MQNTLLDLSDTLSDTLDTHSDTHTPRHTRHTLDTLSDTLDTETHSLQPAAFDLHFENIRRHIYNTQIDLYYDVRKTCEKRPIERVKRDLQTP